MYDRRRLLRFVRRWSYRLRREHLHIVRSDRRLLHTRRTGVQCQQRLLRSSPVRRRPLHETIERMRELRRFLRLAGARPRRIARGSLLASAAIIDRIVVGSPVDASPMRNADPLDRKGKMG